jgi:hypothetical protein
MVGTQSEETIANKHPRAVWFDRGMRSPIQFLDTGGLAIVTVSRAHENVPLSRVTVLIGKGSQANFKFAK